ncbi:quinone oxidoreductase family protein [Actinotalea solisilvae]|uniref:quinone oxidoreductase family protein n=1 Tax=Actinotalea solisilvae TaxID=2072922 RepID=UPI0018F1B39B|nr:quinone oxidoreductase [Actinotalea solisilvae]
MRAIQVTTTGGPEALVPTELPDPSPGPGEALVRVAAVGVNFIDTYRRSGVYPVTLPHVPGDEGAGVVVEVGPDVARVAPGDRVAWADGSSGSYAALTTVRAERLVHVPDGVDDAVAAAVMLQGMTAHYLVDATFPVRAGQTVLVHAGAGGVGLLLTQMARARGARVLATVSSAAKAELAAAAGAEVIRYDAMSDLTTELSARVRELAEGGVHTVFDGVGRTTFDASLASLRRRGGLALFGGASGQVPPVDLQRLNRAGSVYVTRPTLGHYVATRDELEERAAAVLGAVADGSLDVRIGARFALADAADAHRALEGRATTGKVLLVP